MESLAQPESLLLEAGPGLSEAFLVKELSLYHAAMKPLNQYKPEVWHAVA